jgi:hypothetical protein
MSGPLFLQGSQGYRITAYNRDPSACCVAYLQNYPTKRLECFVSRIGVQAEAQDTGAAEYSIRHYLPRIFAHFSIRLREVVQMVLPLCEGLHVTELLDFSSAITMSSFSSSSMQRSK